MPENIAFGLIGLLLILSYQSMPTMSEDQPQSIQNTLINVGGYRLQFYLTRGKLPTIIFEAGGGDNAAVWREVAPSVGQATGASMVAYDRAGFGRSDPDPGPYSIQDEVEALERGL